MRITAGQYRGRILKAPGGDAVRPTSDKVRQAIFNMLVQYGHPVDSVVLDAFSGSGALGIEALSRGAASCTFLDRDKTSLAFTKENAAMLKIADEAQFFLKDSTAPGPRPAPMSKADLIFLDPPYRKGLIIASLNALIGGGWIADGAMIVAESEGEWDGAGLPGKILSEKSYGDTLVRIIRV